MGQRDILSIDSVDRIRFYVKKKYEHLPKERHAEIVADAIVKIIMRQLPPFYKELQDDICQQLIAEVIVAKRRPVSLVDIEKLCLTKAKDDAIVRAQLLEWQIKHGLMELSAPTSNPFAMNWLDKLRAFWLKQRKTIAYSLGCLVIVCGVLVAQAIQLRNTNHAKVDLENIAIVQGSSEEMLAEQLPPNELPKHYQYHEVNHIKLKEYLATRNSLLADDHYYEALFETAKEFNVSPVLLFAITGQEQGFVPRDHEKAEQIANNPFNVFHSWQEYNTSIEQSSQIAARTIVNLSKDRPEEVEAIAWINRKYAEDPNWSNGVTSIFATITNYIND